MNDQLFSIIIHKMNILETKVDELIAFKYYFIGIAAAVSTCVSIIFKALFFK